VKKITLTVSDVSEVLGVSTATIYAMVREKSIPFIRVRGRILFNRDVIINWTKGKQDTGIS